MTATDGATVRLQERPPGPEFRHEFAMVTAEFFVEWQVAEEAPLVAPSRAGSEK